MTPRKPTHFEEMDFPHEEDHPLDEYSRNRLPHELKERIETLLGEYCQHRLHRSRKMNGVC